MRTRGRDGDACRWGRLHGELRGHDGRTGRGGPAMMRRQAVIGRPPLMLIVVAALAAGCSGGGSTDSSAGTATATTEPAPVTTQPPSGSVWPMFGVTPDRANRSNAPTGITA